MQLEGIKKTTRSVFMENRKLHYFVFKCDIMHPEVRRNESKRRILRVIDELVYFSPHLLPRFTRFFSQEIQLKTTKLTLKIKNLAMAYCY